MAASSAQNSEASGNNRELRAKTSTGDKAASRGGDLDPSERQEVEESEEKYSDGATTYTDHPGEGGSQSEEPSQEKQSEPDSHQPFEGEVSTRGVQQELDESVEKDSDGATTYPDSSAEADSEAEAPSQEKWSGADALPSVSDEAEGWNRLQGGGENDVVEARFLEVEVFVDGGSQAEALRSLPQAPGAPFEERSDPRRVVLQLAPETVLQLVQNGVNLRIVREFALVRQWNAHPSDQVAETALLACTGTNREGSNSSNVNIPDNGAWVYSPITISGAPSGAGVTCIDVHYEIIHTYIGDLDVDLNDQNLTYNYDLWGPDQGGGTDNLNQTVTGITTFNGELVNQQWRLYAQDTAAVDVGYINYWWIKVYYDSLQPADLIMTTPNSASPTSNISPNSLVTLTETVRNQGTGPAGAFRVMWYISTDSTMNTSDRAWCYRNVSSLAPATNSSDTGTCNWPTTGTGSTTGTYWIAPMADDQNTVAESNEGNNWFLPPIQVTVGCANPPAPSNPAPPDGATAVPLDTNLCWNTSAKLAKVIYGTDDRLDVYQVSNPATLAAADSTVALVYDSNLIDNGNGTYTFLSALSFTDTILNALGFPLCLSERFRDQPVAAFCSGFLVGPDLVVTAGHCIDDAADCAGKALVFGFDMVNATTPVLTFPASDVYWCDSIVGRVLTDTGADWAVIRVDRAVAGHDPLPIRCSGTISNGRSLLLIGHPVGLPTKIAGGATVRDNGPSTHFRANVDSYGGNSGSAVFDTTTLTVEGVLVRGQEDFVLDGNCIRSNVCPDSGCPGWEAATRTTEFAHLVPECRGDEYDVYFGSCGNLQFRETTTNLCWNPPTLSRNTRYCWGIVARNDCGETSGPDWSFTTADCLIDSDCDDGAFCNGRERCVNETCVSGSDPCAFGPECANHCNEATQSCNTPGGFPCESVADDACTRPDTCDGFGTCQPNHVPDGTSCPSNGLFCDGAEVCHNGVCVSPGNPCYEDKWCNEVTESCFDLGDWDGDGDHDFMDASKFTLCFSGSWEQPGYVAPKQDCRLVFDGDGDGDIDRHDWNAFRLRMTGPTE